MNTPSNAEARELVERWKALAIRAIDCVHDAQRETNWGEPFEGPSVWERLRDEQNELLSEAATLPSQDSSGDARELLAKAAATFRRYEELHRAKGTAEAYEKSKANGALAHEIECFLNAEAALSRQDRPEGVGELRGRLDRCRDVAKLIAENSFGQVASQLVEMIDDAIAALASRSAPDGWVLAEQAFREGFAAGDFAGGGNAAPFAVDDAWEQARQALAPAPPAPSDYSDEISPDQHAAIRALAGVEQPIQSPAPSGKGVVERLGAMGKLLADMGESDFATAASGEFGEDLLNRLVGLCFDAEHALSTSSRDQAFEEAAECWSGCDDPGCPYTHPIHALKGTQP